MRTSLDEINRAYLKFYSNPDTLVRVKAEPTADLINRVSSGQIDNPITINNQVKIKEEPIDEEYLPIQQQQPTISINERKRLTANNWFKKIKNSIKQMLKHEIMTHQQHEKDKKGLSFISNRQRRKEGTLRASGVGGDRTHASLPQWSRVCPP